MSVMQRKLFANKEARTKLRDMGGIMSSFPELSGEVQRFQDGMMVEAPRPPTGPTLMDRLQAGSLLRETPRLSLDQATRRLLDAGMAPEELQQYVDQGIDLNYLLAQLPPETPPMRSPAAEEVQRINRSRIAGTTTGTATEKEPSPAEEGPGMTTGTPIYEHEAELLPPTPTEEEGPGMTTGTPIYEQRIADLLPTSTETPDETGGGETDTPDLRARAEERIKLFQDLFGSDEPTARDRAMQFAMIGLAIAAGQSPNALTNIASGLLAGTQAMAAQEAERRKERRALRSSAVTSVLDEMEAERKAGEDPLSKLYGESTSDLETKHFGSVPQFTPTLPGVMGGLQPIVAGEQDRILTTYNTLMDESDRLLGLSAEAQYLLDTGDVAGFEGSASRFMSRAAAALPDSVASALGVDAENQRVSAAQRFDVIQRILAAQLAPMLLGESGRTISDADRLKVAEIIGVAVDNKDGTGLNIRKLSDGAFRSEAELREAIGEVQNILQRNRKEVEDEFLMLSNRIPGFSVTQPETPATTQSGPASIVLTEEDVTRYGG